MRFPTSHTLAGSDAMNPDGDYSASYVELRTSDPDLAGYGFTFTIGRGNELCVAAAEMIGAKLVGRDVDELVTDLGGLYRELAGDSQMRWLGPEKGVVHLALAAVMNAVWDLAARRAGKPLWRLLVDMTPEEIVAAADLRYISDALTAEEALELLRKQQPTRQERIDDLQRSGFPAYTTSPGWIGYSDEQMVELTRQALADGFRHIKLKVGRSLEEDLRRCALVREVIGPEVYLMVDSNQVWDVPVAIDWLRELEQFDLHWAEEPTSPDDVLGHAAIRRALSSTKVASGEHVHNRVMFKQFFQAGAIDFCQLDSCRLGSVNEILTVLLLAAKFEIPVCPHAGGVGLCEFVQHLASFDYIAVAGTKENRVAEYVEDLHEHFTDPVRIEQGAYALPSEPGYSGQMHPESVAEYRYPDGGFWSDYLEGLAS